MPLETIYFYFLFFIIIPDEITPLELIVKLKETLKDLKVSNRCFSTHILSCDVSLFGKLIDSASKLSWNELSEKYKDYFKVIYKWINDEDNFEKIISKDPTVIERKSLNNISKSIQREETVSDDYTYNIDNIEIESLLSLCIYKNFILFYFFFLLKV